MISPVKIIPEETYPVSYSICTFVTDPQEYSEMVGSFRTSGFTEKDCEFLYADNSVTNNFEAFGGINRFLRQAKGKYIIICHQDILVNIDNRIRLEEQINTIDKLDARWAVLGNAGSSDLYRTSMVITENGKLYRSGKLPSKVHSLDENFLLVRSEANLAVSGDLSGFHLYGTDICLVAECLGWTAYAIDFNLTHKSSGRMNQAFYEIRNALQKKYDHFFRGRYIKTTITRFYLSSSSVWSIFMNLGLIKSIVRLYYKIRNNVQK